MKHCLLLLFTLLMTLCLCGCVDNTTMPAATHELDEGTLTDCVMGITVDDYVVSTTRASDYVTDGSDETVSAEEKAVSNIWVFQFDKDTKSLLIKPRYYTAADHCDANGRWSVVLKPDVASTVYVVTNTGSSTWAETWTDFKTIDALKAQTLPAPNPIQVGSGDEVLIPMCGSKEVQTTDYASDINIPVERMYAKLKIKASMLKEEMNLTAIEVNNIPWTCRVETRSCADNLTDTEEEKQAADYPASTQWITRSFDTAQDATTDNADDSGMKTTKEYVIYVPENIQGENDNPDKSTIKGANNSKANALAVNFHLNVLDKTDNSIVVSEAMLYPGGNTYNNFNIKRNRVYRVTANFKSVSYFFPTPSANCFIVEPGNTLTFFPYYRTEKGGGYDIRTYLDPTVEDLKISSVYIVWQDKGVIGDNSNGKLVTMSDITVPEGTKDTYEYIKSKFRINVKTANEGNALIAARNSKGEIIWSWHIWVTANDPGNVGKAIRYTTYEWDSSGIKADASNPSSNTRVPGYQVMSCNLGALADAPVSGDDESKYRTYGLLYQWGRKDPFPQMKRKPRKNGYYNYDSKTARIKVYDNENKQIKMSTDGSYKNTDASQLFNAELNINTGTTEAEGLKYAIQHPTTFISATNQAFTGSTAYNVATNYTNGGDWLPDSIHDDKLWGGAEPKTDQSVMKSYKVNSNMYLFDNYGSEKSIFDPSPAGWRVAPGDLWLGLTSNGQNMRSNSMTVSGDFWTNVNSPDNATTTNNNYGFNVYLDGWKTGSTTFFPAQGSRLASGQPMYGGICGNYHNATASQGNIVNILHFHVESDYFQINTFEPQLLYKLKAVGGPIRCVRDKR